VDEDEAPADITDEHERWLFVLNEMIWTFETMGSSLHSINDDEETIKQKRIRLRRGVKLFAKYFNNLTE
jgi:hypothetical protein